jgi:hypothetical protein
MAALPKARRQRRQTDRGKPKPACHKSGDFTALNMTTRRTIAGLFGAFARGDLERSEQLALEVLALLRAGQGLTATRSR